MRKLAFVLSGYIAGIAVAAIKLNIIPAIIASLLLAIFLRAIFGGKRGLIVGTAVIIAFCVGAGQFAAVKESKDDFLEWAKGKYLTMHVKVDELPEKSDDYYMTIVKIKSINYVDQTYECSEKLAIYSKDKPAYAFCDTLKIVATVHAPEDAKFDGGFDAGRYLRSKGITGTAFTSNSFITRTGSDITFFDKTRAIRYTIENKIDDIFNVISNSRHICRINSI